MANKKFWEDLTKQIESMSDEEFTEAVRTSEELGQLFAIEEGRFLFERERNGGTRRQE